MSLTQLLILSSLVSFMLGYLVRDVMNPPGTPGGKQDDSDDSGPWGYA